MFVVNHCPACRRPVHFSAGNADFGLRLHINHCDGGDQDD